jgi:hypothetical protein
MIRAGLDESKVAINRVFGVVLILFGAKVPMVKSRHIWLVTTYRPSRVA